MRVQGHARWEQLPSADRERYESLVADLSQAATTAAICDALGVERRVLPLQDQGSVDSAPVTTLALAHRHEYKSWGALDDVYRAEQKILPFVSLVGGHVAWPPPEKHQHLPIAPDSAEEEA